MSTQHIAVVGLGTVCRKTGTALARRTLVEYLSALAGQGPVTWFTSRQSDNPELAEPLPQDVRVVEIGCRGLWRNVAALRALPPDTLYVIAFPAMLTVWPFFLLSGRRRVLLYLGNDVFARPQGAQSTVARLKWLRRLLITLVCAPRATTVAARGRVLARRMARLNRRVFETLPITLPLRRSPGIGAAPPAQPYVLFAGKLMPEKGIRELLAAYEADPDPGSLPRLAVAGEGPLRDEVRDRAAASDRIEVLGFVNDPAQLAELYARASAVMLPTRGEWEGVPRVLSEALSFGVPIWATPLPTIRGEFGDGIRYFASARPTPAEIGAALRSVVPFRGERDGGLEGAGSAALQHLAALRDSGPAPRGAPAGLSAPGGRA
jgi:glycosyltransferase involved in cell wall biosynthesis